jgi:acyl carrier protein
VERGRRGLPAAREARDRLKLVSLIEEEFDVEIDDDDVVPDNWKTIRHVAALVESKRSQ